MLHSNVYSLDAIFVFKNNSELPNYSNFFQTNMVNVLLTENFVFVEIQGFTCSVYFYR